MKEEKDPMGRAIADFHAFGKADRLRVFATDFDEDEMPVETLFRKYEEMPRLEQIALDSARGTVLDVGAGAGCHALALQERGFDVTAIDISPLSVETMRRRGIQKALEQDFFKIKGQYDTILLLMNGIGIPGTLDRLPLVFLQLDQLLAKGGQLLCDSSDIAYVYEDEAGNFEFPEERYYGEMVFQMQYCDIKGDAFHWVYIDPTTLSRQAELSGYKMEILAKGSHFDYLARITKKDS